MLRGTGRDHGYGSSESARALYLLAWHGRTSWQIACGLVPMALLSSYPSCTPFFLLTITGVVSGGLSHSQLKACPVAAHGISPGNTWASELFHDRGSALRAPLSNPPPPLLLGSKVWQDTKGSNFC